MKYIIKLIAVLLFSTSAMAQPWMPLLPRTLPNPSSKIYYKLGYMQADSGYLFTSRDTVWRPKYPALVYWQHTGVDSSFWYYNKFYWQKVGVGVGGNIAVPPSNNFGLPLVLSATTVRLDTTSVYGAATRGRLYKTLDSLAKVGVLGFYATDGLIGILGQAGAIDTVVIADQGVTAPKIASSAVTTVKISDGAITNAKMANDVKIGSLAALQTVDKTSVVAAINEVKATGGGGGGGSGDKIMLSSTSVTAGSTSFTFDLTAYTATYSTFVIRIMDAGASAAGDMAVQISNGGSTFPSTGYTWNTAFPANTPNVRTSGTDNPHIMIAMTAAATSGYLNSCTLTLERPNFSKKPRLYWETRGFEWTGSPAIQSGIAYYETAQVTTHIRILMLGGITFAGGGVIQLWGEK